MKKFTFIFALLAMMATTAMADFTAYYTSSTSWTAAEAGDISTDLQTVITSHGSDGTVYYRTNEVTISADGDITATFTYTGGSHRMAILGMEILDSEGTVVVSDYHEGSAGGSPTNTTYTLTGATAGDYIVRYFVCNKAGDHALNNTNGNIAFVGSITEKTLDVDPISTEYFYQIKNVAYSRMLTATDSYAGVTSTNDVTDLTQLWAFEAVEGSEGVYKLRNNGKGLYLGHNGSNNQKWPVNETGSEFTISVQKYPTASDATTYYVIKHPDSDEYSYAHDANWGGTEQIVRWLATAPASQWIFIKTDISTTAQAIEFTYSLKYDGEEIYSETKSGFVGEAYPSVSTSLPFGVTATIPTTTIEAGIAGTTIDVELSVNLPFVPATSYETITNWYYMNISNGARYLYHTADAEYIDLTKTAVDTENKDAYTWAFVGDPFNGYQIVNKAAGSSMILSSSTTTADGNTGGNTYPIMTATPVADGNNTLWVATSSSDRGENGFYLAQKDYASNIMNNRDNKLAYWNTGADAGSTFEVEERDLSGATELQAAIDAIKNKYTEGTTVGCIESLTALNEAIANAETAVANKTGCDEALVALQAAKDALVTVQPTEGTFYHIASAVPASDSRSGKKIYVNDSGYMHFQDASTMGEVFQFVPAGDNMFYLYNVERGTYLNTAKGHGGGQHTALATTTENAVKVTISNLGSANIVEIVPEGGAMIHAQSDYSAVVGWDNESYEEASAWIISEVTDITALSHDVTVSDAGYATLYLNYAVTIPEGVNVYGITEATNGWAIMDKISGTIPAKTGVILENAGEFTFNYSNEAGEGTSILKGTLLDENKRDDAYVLAVANEQVGLYLATKNQDENTTFKNNAFKAYLVPEVQENIASYSFNFDWNGTTGIENIEGAAEEENATETIYDITGRQIKAITVPGIYIINGKKTFVK